MKKDFDSETAARRCDVKGGSPVFTATFADGETTRMTVFQSREKLDFGRGVRLARAAYESRMRKGAPRFVEAHYERDGEVLESYGREQLDALSKEGAS